MSNETTNSVATETVKLTREQKLRQKYDVLVQRIQKDTEAAQEIAQELNSVAALASVAVGTTVIVKLGRAETTREVVGVVIGVKEEEDGAKLFKVQYGVGFDADIAVVGAAKISLPPSEPAAE